MLQASNLPVKKKHTINIQIYIPILQELIIKVLFRDVIHTSGTRIT